MEKPQTGKQYKKISYELRIKLIDMVCEQNIPCAAAAQNLGLSASTAKMIIKKFKEDGKIFEKKEDKAKREILEEFKSQLQRSEAGRSSSPESKTEEQPTFFYYQPLQP